MALAASAAPAAAAQSARGPAPLAAAHAALETSTDRITVSILESTTVTNTFQLWNGAAAPQGPMTFLITESISWLQVTPANGAVSNNRQTITAVFSAGALPAGTYTGSLNLDALDGLDGQRAYGAPKSISITLVVARRQPLNLEKPQVRGALFVGQTATAWQGLWQNAGRLTFAYRWQMASDKYGRGLADIRDGHGALITGTNCVLPAAVRGKYIRVQVTATDPDPTPLSTTVTSDFADARRVNAPPDDFSGDGRSDLWLFYPPAAVWKVAFYTNAEATLFFGSAACAAAPKDYDGDGRVDPAVYEEASGVWSVMLSASGYATASVRFGGPGFRAVPADFDGDGKADPATYHEDSGLWSALLSGNSYLPAGCEHGGPGYAAVTGCDFDGDGKADPTVYQAAGGLWLALLSASGYPLVGGAFGGPDYTPAPGDFDGDCKTDVGVYRAASNWWWVRSSQTGAVRDGTFGPSNGAGFPAPGYYDRDGLCDPAVIYQAGDFMVWCILRSSAGYRGQSFQFSQERWRVSW